MAGKSRRRHQPRTKKRKGSPGSPAIAVQQRESPQPRESVGQPKETAPVAEEPSPIATLTAARYPYLGAELRRIGILAGIMLVILVVLVLILS